MNLRDDKRRFECATEEIASLDIVLELEFGDDVERFDPDSSLINFSEICICCSLIDSSQEE